MTCRKSSRYSKGIFLCLLYLLITLLPVICLMLSGEGAAKEIWNTRRAGLMANSFVIAVFTVAACLMIAAFASMRIHTGFQKKPFLRWYFLLLAPVPPYIYALSYMNLLRFLGRFFPELLRVRMTGIFPCVVVETFAYLPFACAAALVALDQVNQKEWSAALLLGGSDRAFFQVVLPAQIPWLLAIGAILFVLSVMD